MKNKYTFVLILQTVNFIAQQDFYSLYNQVTDSMKRVNSITENYFNRSKSDTTALNDTLAMKKVYKEQKVIYKKIITPLLRNVINKTLPDISFTDKAFESHHLSDYSKNNLVLNYNYLYCKPCLNRIDSTLSLIHGKNIKMIVLLQDIYRKDFDDLSRYEDKVQIGFINPETRSLISFDIGDDQMYLIDKYRKVIYFDGIEELNHRENWLNFLKTYNAAQ